MNATLRAVDLGLAEDPVDDHAEEPGNWADSMDQGLVARLERRIQSYVPGTPLHVEVRYGEADIVRAYLRERLATHLGEAGSVTVEAKAPRKNLDAITAPALAYILDDMIVNRATVHLTTGDRLAMVTHEHLPPHWQAHLAPAVMDGPMTLEQLLRWMQGTGRKHIVDTEMAEATKELGREMEPKDRFRAERYLMHMRWKGAFVEDESLRGKGEVGKAASMVNKLAENGTHAKLVPLEVVEALFSEDSDFELVEIDNASLRWSTNFRALILTENDVLIYLKRDLPPIGDMNKNVPVSMSLFADTVLPGANVVLRENAEGILIDDREVKKVWFLLEKGARDPKTGITPRV